MSDLDVPLPESHGTLSFELSQPHQASSGMDMEPLSP